MIPQLPPKPDHTLKYLCASCLVLECTGRDQYHMNASICGRHEPVTLEHLRAASAPKPGERVVDCREWDILNDIARIVRPRCRPLDNEELVQAIRQLDANRAVVKVLGSIAP